jgi:signal transduction histidine kinase
MKTLSLYGRIAGAFAAIVLSLGIVLAWLGYSAAKLHQHEILQRVNMGLAGHIAAHPDLLRDEIATDALFAQLSAVNPNIALYLLDTEGNVIREASGSTLVRSRVDLAPVRALIDGSALPVRGDDPRHTEHSEIFSAAPLTRDGRLVGYVYIVLLNDMYRGMVAEAWRGYVLRSSAWIAGLAVALAIVGGLIAFAWITRRLHATIREIEAFAAGDDTYARTVVAERGDEIDRLGAAFARMRRQLKMQMQELRRQDELRRELVANVSHDLRTPLTSMQGYLETLARLDERITPEERRHHLDVAVRQSHRVSHLAAQLFELARLECEETQPQPELFSIAELAHDIVQKFAIAARQKSIALSIEVDAGPLCVYGDIGMIERAIGNLVDNALKHTPPQGEIRLHARHGAEGVEVRISDTGRGISEEQLPGLLQRGSSLRRMAMHRGGGLGLLIVNRILDLHGSSMRAVSRVGEGTSISFVLPTANVA